VEQKLSRDGQLSTLPASPEINYILPGFQHLILLLKQHLLLTYISGLMRWFFPITFISVHGTVDRRYWIRVFIKDTEWVNHYLYAHLPCWPQQLCGHPSPFTWSAYFILHQLTRLSQDQGLGDRSLSQGKALGISNNHVVLLCDYWGNTNHN